MSLFMLLNPLWAKPTGEKYPFVLKTSVSFIEVALYHLFLLSNIVL